MESASSRARDLESSSKHVRKLELELEPGSSKALELERRPRFRQEALVKTKTQKDSLLTASRSFRCAETEPEQSSRAAGRCGSTSGTWNGESNCVYLRLQATLYDSKQLCTTVLFIFWHVFDLGLSPTNQNHPVRRLVTGLVLSA